MAHFIPATLTLTALAAFGVLSNAPKHQSARIPQFQAQLMAEKANQWTIHNQNNGAQCISQKTDGGIFNSTPACNDVSPKLASGDKWQSHEDGILIVDQNGDIVLNFAPSPDSNELVSDSLLLKPAS